MMVISASGKVYEYFIPTRQLPVVMYRDIDLPTLSSLTEVNTMPCGTKKGGSKSSGNKPRPRPKPKPKNYDALRGEKV